jgi:hypothetical protein
MMDPEIGLLGDCAMTPSMIRRMILALGTAALVASIAAPARADDDDGDRHHGRGREHREREWHEREWRDAPPAVIYTPPPPVYYAPPPAVYYAPPPAVIYVAPPRPAFEIEIPIHIR